jgi:multiple sugar transport system ATP-binding protein
VVLGVRPEDQVVGGGAEGPVLEGEVLLVEPLGPDLFLQVAVPEATLRARTSSLQRFTVGERVRLGLPPARLHVFDAATERALAG